MHLVLMNMFSYCKSGSHATAYPSFANHISLLILISVNHKIIITEISYESYADDLHGFSFVGALFLLSIKKRNTGSSQVFSEYQKCLIPFLLSSMVPDLNCVYYKEESFGNISPPNTRWAAFQLKQYCRFKHATYDAFDLPPVISFSNIVRTKNRVPFQH